jgi:hypothetical protein
MFPHVLHRSPLASPVAAALNRFIDTSAEYLRGTHIAVDEQDRVQPIMIRRTPNLATSSGRGLHAGERHLCDGRPHRGSAPEVSI